MDIRFGMGFLLLSFLSLVLPSSQQNNQTTASYQISRKPCYVKGQEGTCMFVWECVKTEGTPLGMCMERFMFGSCCAHDLDNDVFPKQPTTVAGLAVSQPASSSANTAGTPSTSTTSILTTLIASTLIPNATPWRTNSTNNETALEAESTTEPTTPGSSYLPDDETLATTVFYEHNASTISTSSDELLSTTSPTHNTVTLSPLPTTTDSTTPTSLPTSSPTKTHPSVSTTKPTGSQPTPGPIKLRPKPYRRTTTRRAAIPTVAPGTNSPLTVSTSTGPRNHTLASSLAPPNNAPPAINLLLPNTILYPSTQTNTPPVTSSHSLIPTIQLITTTLQHPDVLVALTVPSPFLSPITTEPQSATLTSHIELADTLASINEINATDPIPNTIPTASNTPYYDPYFHGHITTGLSSSTTAEAHSNLPAETSSEKTTAVTTGTTTTITSTASPIATSLTTKKYTGVIVTVATSVSSIHADQNTSTTESSSLKPNLNVTPISYKNTTSTESTRKPILAVTSIPSSYPNIECGVPPILRQQEGRIVGGSNSKFGSWPWQISVRRTSFFGFSSTHRCGGALLNELWVVTAGHCVEDLLVSQIRLRMGEFDFSTVQEPYPFVERGVNKKIVHPKYNFFTYEYDLALVRLEEPITFQPNIAPICLPATDESLIGQNGTVTGWGRLSEGGTLPSMLQQVTVPIVSNDKCKDMFLKAGRHEYIPDIFMCAGFEEGGRDSCQGDSGGPLQIRGRDGKYFLAGIISWGIGCAEANLPGVCTRISKFTSWILENVT